MATFISGIIMAMMSRGNLVEDPSSILAREPVIMVFVAFQSDFKLKEKHRIKYNNFSAK